MVYTCWVCKWRGDKEPKRSFHRFPSNENQRKKWEHILGINNVVLGARTTICSLHFTENCFHYSVDGKRLIKEGSFPSLHLLTPAVVLVQEERTEPLTNELECSTKNIAIKRSDEVIEDGIPNKQICLKNRLLERSTTYESINSNLPLQYLKKKMIFKNKEILSLKRKNWRLSLSKSKLKSCLKEVQSKNAKLITEKKLMQKKLGSIPKALFSLLQSKKKKVASYPLSLRIFASTLSFMSPKAYKYVRNAFPVLPHLATLRKWHAEIDVKPGIYQAASEILTEKHVETNNTGKKALM
ncbi:PREDICTED: THAP domain-containing protein 2-like [Trachymyrmex cornetzi]|uniref:THAP domain-containing protein 2-like n=1 Tax=Trachymyrmex cornetzi TaxID=471704 RepID=UPI00084F76A4|nr:PREDICTED: THAP domain-containing protein 2-like [Trachymyrmex cornetzi]